ILVPPQRGVAGSLLLSPALGNNTSGLLAGGHHARASPAGKRPYPTRRSLPDHVADLFLAPRNAMQSATAEGASRHRHQLREVPALHKAPNRGEAVSEQVPELQRATDPDKGLI